VPSRFTSPRLQSLLRGDLSDIRGTHATGSIPIREHLINAAVNKSRRGPVEEFDIRVGDNNRLQVGVRVSIGPFSKWFRPELVLNRQALWSNSPGLLFTMSGSQYSLAVHLVEIFAKTALPSGIHIKNNQIAVDIGAMPQAAPYRGLFEHIKELQVTTELGVLWVEFQLGVTNETVAANTD
jgi:hypothetical protein